jgi:hypothetical protein
MGISKASLPPFLPPARGDLHRTKQTAFILELQKQELMGELLQLLLRDVTLAAALLLRTIPTTKQTLDLPISPLCFPPFSHTYLAVDGALGA